jgi:hypothetical protein
MGALLSKGIDCCCSLVCILPLLGRLFPASLPGCDIAGQGGVPKKAEQVGPPDLGLSASNTVS